MDAKELAKVLVEHKKWLEDPTTGKRAYLSGANLYGADLSGANLSRAYLSGANLSGANLSRADLSGATLSGANLSEANLSEANLYGANLSRADLSGAHLSRADLSRADLSGADLSGANLSGANLSRADTTKTCLDPTNQPSGASKDFQKVRGYVIGYRTRKAGHIPTYQDGQHYSADWFSTDSAECHPGLYLWPTIQQAKEFSGDVQFIRVRTKAKDIHQAGKKWRCRWFEVLGEAK
jgi:hypothetical protein